MKKPVLIEFDFTTSSKTANPPVKQRLELSTKKEKEFKLEDVMGKLEQANKKRKSLQKQKTEKLLSLSKKNEEKIKRRHSCEEEEMQKQRGKVMKDHKEVDQRRTQRINSLVGRLHSENKKVIEKCDQVKKKRKNKHDALKKKIAMKQESAERQRKKLIDEMVKRLDQHNAIVTKRAKERKLKKQEQPKEVPPEAHQEMGKEIPHTKETSKQSARDAVNKQKSMQHEHVEVEKK